MKLFQCRSCGHLLHFEDAVCERCNVPLGFVAGRMDLLALQEAEPGRWVPLGLPAEAYRRCANDRHGVCNWLVPADSGLAFCAACQLNRTIPDLSRPAHIEYWSSLERAKHRLVYALLRLGLPLSPRAEHPEVGLAFDFVSPEAPSPEGMPVMTGHARGLITISIMEADDVERERFRANLAEPYRTVLGHLRHEVGHYYWERLVEDTPTHGPFRELFGDERTDYVAALETHYALGTVAPAPTGEHITAYAASHPWEDWAECWAHYLHLLDTVETAYWFGLGVAPKAGQDEALTMVADLDPYLPVAFEELERTWFPLILLGNSLNRSVGLPDLYPFTLTEPVLQKLRFVHQVARGQAARGPAGGPPVAPMADG